MAQASGVLSPLPQPLVLPQPLAQLNLGLLAQSSPPSAASLTLMATLNNSLVSTPLALIPAPHLVQPALASQPGIKHLVELPPTAQSPGRTKVPLVFGKLTVPSRTTLTQVQSTLLQSFGMPKPMHSSAQPIVSAPAALSSPLSPQHLAGPTQKPLG